MRLLRPPTTVVTFIALFFLVRASGAQQTVTLEKLENGYRAKGTSYTVSVRGDGCLGGLQVEGEDFLPKRGRAAAGGYL